MRKSYYFLILHLTILIVACGDTIEQPEEVFSKMKSSACAANKKEFYTHIDKNSVDKNFKESVLRVMNVEGADEKGNQELDPYTVKEMAEIVIPNIIILKWELINQQISLGDSGAICNLELIGKAKDGNVLEIQYPDGSKADWGFEKILNRFLLVSMSDSSPLEIIGPKWDINSIVRAQVQNDEEAIISDNKQDIKALDRDTNEGDKVEETSSAVKAPEKDYSLVKESEEKDKVIVQEKPEENRELASTEKDLTSQGVEEVNKVPRVESRAKSPKTSAGNEDFGNARWGMNREQVVSAQRSEPIYEEGDILKFNGIFLGMSAQVTYIFSKNRLVKGMYNLYGDKSDESYYLKNYLRIKELLSLKYGTPTADEEVWINSLYEDDPDRHGFALQIGHLAYKTRWSAKRTNVLLELKSGNYDTLLEAYFFSK